MNSIKALIFCSAALVSAASLAADAPKPDPWAPVRFLVGSWEGTTEGAPGRGTVKRTYEFVLDGRFIYERNTSTYPPQEKNPKGEEHEHWSFLSYDRQRQMIVLRQFHEEGFVNQYVQATADGDGARIIFDSEAFENLDSKWRAREIYEIVGPNEFIETFQLAQPGKEFETYSKNRFVRAADH